MIVTVIQAIGIPGSGTCGFIMATTQFNKTASGIIVGIFLLIIAIGFAICACGDILMLTKVSD